MAKATTSIVMNLTFLFALSLLVFSILVESRAPFGESVRGVDVSLQCNSVLAVKKGDTCFDVANSFKLSTQRFNFINPNLNCSALFVGQWLCVNGFSI